MIFKGIAPVFIVFKIFPSGSPIVCCLGNDFGDPTESTEKRRNLGTQID
jgi:hypothetical protein